MSTADDIRLDYIWRWGTFGERKKHYQYETLYAHHQVAEQQLKAYVGLEKHQREWHRREVGNMLIPAIYNGWMVKNIQWFEGYVDDMWALGSALREFRDLRPGDGMYHYWTKVELEAFWQQPQIKRGENPFSNDPLALASDLTFSTYTPRAVDSKDLL